MVKNKELKYYMMFDKETSTFTLTNTKTYGATIFSSIEEVLTFILKNKSCTVYFYDLTKAADAIANTILRQGYTERFAHEFTKSIKGKLDNKEFMCVGSSRPRRTIELRIRRTKNIQATFRNVSELFGKGTTEEDIAIKFGGNSNIQIGLCDAITFLEEINHTGMTVASNAKNELKRTCFASEEDFSGNGEKGKLGLCPKLSQEQHDFVMESLQGGLCYYNEDYLGDYEVEGKCYDVNSLYPSILKNEFLPVGKAVEFKGRFIPTKNRPFYFQKVVINRLSLKEDGIPCIKNRNADENLNDEEEYFTHAMNVELVLNNIDMQMLFDNYYVKGIEYKGGLSFMAAKNKFNNFINKWTLNKIKAKKEGNNALYHYSKLMLNGSIGGFISKNDRKVSKYVNTSFLLKDKSKAKFVKTELDFNGVRQGNITYAPIGCFVTSYGRQRLIKAIKENKENFLYCDTDSIYVKGEAKGLNIDEYELGAWKEEFSFTNMNILSKKKYCVKKTDGDIKSVIAGCPDKAKEEQIKTYEDFHIGKVIGFETSNFNENGQYIVNKECSIELKMKH